MPIERIESNPLTGTGVYYPASAGRLFAYHGISGRPERTQKMEYIYEMYETVATEEAFRTIWKQGVLYSHASRVAMGERGPSSMIFGMDKVAGDDDFVFLTVAQPHSVGHRGYHLVFDPYQLVQDGAKIGLWDLQSFYMQIADRIGVPNRNDESTWNYDQVAKFLEDANFVKDVWRISDGEASEWLEWIQGVRKKSPVNANALRYIARQVADIGYHNIRWLSTDRKVAINRSELLVPKKLSLKSLVGVIFRKQWIEIGDFVDYYGHPGSEPPPAVSIHQANLVDITGNPARCPRCHDWMSNEPLAIPEGSIFSRSVWHDRMQGPGMEQPGRVMVCKACDAAFGHKTGGFMSHDDPFSPEEYICQYSDMQHVSPTW